MLPPWLWVVCLSFRLCLITTNAPTKQVNYWDGLASRLWGKSASPSPPPGLPANWLKVPVVVLFWRSKALWRCLRHNLFYSACLWTPHPRQSTANYGRFWASSSIMDIGLQAHIEDSSFSKLGTKIEGAPRAMILKRRSRLLWQTSIFKNI